LSANDRAVFAALREELLAARDTGVEFGDAWGPALAHALRGANRGQRERLLPPLTATVDAWSAAYNGHEPDRMAAAAAVLAT
jgi:hypothetical protein